MPNTKGSIEKRQKKEENDRPDVADGRRNMEKLLTPEDFPSYRRGNFDNLLWTHKNNSAAANIRLLVFGNPKFGMARI